MTKKKPTHAALLKPTHIQKLAQEGKLPKRAYSVVPPEEPQKRRLPVVQPKRPKMAAGARKVALKAKVRAMHRKVQPLPEEMQPDCDSCKTAACCYAFLVPLLPAEYESGLYDEYAVKLTPDDVKNLRFGALGVLAVLNVPGLTTNTDSDQYYLEGAFGQPCVFLDDNARCSIYDKRPLTCRAYTCVGDDRITEEMRQGTVDLREASLARLTKVKNVK